MTPFRRYDVRIPDNDMLSFDGVLEGIDAHVAYKKAEQAGLLKQMSYGNLMDDPA